MLQRKIKILYLITGLNIGGAENVLYELVKNIDKRRFFPVVVSLTSVGDIGNKINRKGFRVLTIKTRSKDSAIFAFFNLLKILKQNKPDILHTHLFHADILGRMIGRIIGVPIIISTVHNVEIGGKNREILLRLTKNIPSFNVAVAEAVKESALKKGFIKQERVKTIYNGIEVEKYHSNRELSEMIRIRKKLKIPNSLLLAVAVGRIHKQKGYEYLIGAVRSIVNKFSSFKVFVLGDGSKKDKERIKKQIRETKLEDYIILLGNVSNVSDYLKAADLFISSSLWEGLPLAVLEASASGLPVVATKVGGMPEIIEDGISGFLVEPKNPLALAEKIDFLLSLTPEKRKEIGERGRRIVEEKFSLDRMVKEYEDLYQELFLKKVKNFWKNKK